MGFLNSLFGNKDKKLHRDIIEHNADMIERDEGKMRKDAVYLSICLLIDDLSKRPNGKKGYSTVMNMRTNEYSQHHNDILTYIAVQSGMIILKPEIQEALEARHQ